MAYSASEARRQLWCSTERLRETWRIGSASPITVDGYLDPVPALWVASRVSRGRPSPAELSLVVEIIDSDLLDATLELEDLISRYQDGGVAEVWVIDLVERRVIAYRRPVADGPFHFRLYELPGSDVVTHEQTGWSIDVADVLGPM